ncbi:MAG: hypothetical protein MZU95_02750 [Desulfomicrobium escambiense]|nr:hypothetical protein [Desulfomicrobium escambiense]
MANIGSVRISPEVDPSSSRTCRSNPDYRYWYSEPGEQPLRGGRLGSRVPRSMAARCGGRSTPDSATFRKVVGLVQSFPGAGLHTRSGYTISDHQGRPIGVWYSSLSLGVTVDPADQDGIALNDVALAQPVAEDPWRTPQAHHLAKTSGRRTMTETSTFEKVTRSEKILYGPRKLLLCGFRAEARQSSTRVLGMVGTGRCAEGLGDHGGAGGNARSPTCSRFPTAAGRRWLLGPAAGRHRRRHHRGPADRPDDRVQEVRHAAGPLGGADPGLRDMDRRSSFSPSSPASARRCRKK